MVPATATAGTATRAKRRHLTFPRTDLLLLSTDMTLPSGVCKGARVQAHDAVTIGGPDHRCAVPHTGAWPESYSRVMSQVKRFGVTRHQKLNEVLKIADLTLKCARDFQPALLKLGPLGLHGGELSAELGQPRVVGGVGGQLGVQLRLSLPGPGDLPVEPVEFLLGGALRGGTRREPAARAGRALARTRGGRRLAARPQPGTVPRPATAAAGTRRCRRAGAAAARRGSAYCWSVTRSMKYRSCETTMSVPGHESSRSSMTASMSVSMSLVGSSSISTLGWSSRISSSCSRRCCPPDRSLTGVDSCAAEKPSRSSSALGVSSCALEPVPIV